MVPVMVAIAAASNAFRDQKASCDENAILSLESPAAVFGKAGFALSETAEGLLFNIGRIPARQSRQRPFAGGKRQILPPGRKSAHRRRSVVYRIRH
jgi:hypothetical protein